MALITLAASDSESAKALLLCSQLQGVGLKTNESAIRVLNCSNNDTGQTEHHAIVIVKPTGPEEEEQLTYLCADPALGTGARSARLLRRRPAAPPTADAGCATGSAEAGGSGATGADAPLPAALPTAVEQQAPTSAAGRTRARYG